MPKCLRKCQVDEMSSWWNVKLTKCQVDEMSSWQNGQLTKCQVDEMASWWNVVAPISIAPHWPLSKPMKLQGVG